MFVSGATVIENLVGKLPSSRLPMSINITEKAKKQNCKISTWIL